MKGDSITVTIGLGNTTLDMRVDATKGGRTVQHKTSGKWLEVKEMTAPSRANPNGRPAGNMLRLALHSVLAIDVRKSELEALPRKARPKGPKAVSSIPLGLAADG